MQVNWEALGNSTLLKYSLIVFSVFLFGFILSKVLHLIIRRLFNPLLIKSENIDRTTLKFLQNGVSFVVFLVKLIYLFLTIPQLKNVGVTLFAGAGILAAIIGFASQAAFSNIISGIFIVIFNYKIFKLTFSTTTKINTMKIFEVSIICLGQSLNVIK